MAITFPGAAVATNSNATTKDDRPKAQLWLNIGYDSNEVDEDGKPIFISPIGVPVDTHKRREPSGKSSKYNDMISAGNELLDFLEKAGFELEPGEATKVNLQIELRRTAEAVVSTRNENPHVIDLGSLLLKAG